MTAHDTSGLHAREMDAGERFAFGENWSLYLKELDESRIRRAVDSLKDMLEVDSLQGRTFLDIGSGSGLFSLAARRLGARVLSFDFDPRSVACTEEVKRRYAPDDPDWRIETGSVLDASFLEGLGQFDVVYSWGVLHHTGQMWQALANAEARVAPGGQLFIALYNDQGGTSRLWWKAKRLYVGLPPALRWLVLGPAYVRLWGPTFVKDLLRLRPFQSWRNYGAERGMSAHRDVVDWVGGFPFEVCRPEEVLAFYRSRGFALDKLKTCAGGHGCNEFVLRRLA